MSRNGGGGGGSSSYRDRSSCPLDCKVYVGDLGNNGDRRELEDAFGRLGALRNVWVARNPPGFAFVEFENSRDAEDAAREMDGRTLCGRRVRVELSSTRSRPKRFGDGGGRRDYDSGRRGGGRGGRYDRDNDRERGPRGGRSRSRDRRRSRSPRERDSKREKSRSVSAKPEEPRRRGRGGSQEKSSSPTNGKD